MKVFKATGTQTEFDFDKIRRITGINCNEGLLISWYGQYYVCPVSIVNNAIEREKALVKCSEHYRLDSSFKPTMISLDQCLLLDSLVDMEI